ncbi:MAG: hypothetical protein IJ252_05905 [Solobacterium sp.]|nr:hypothetical protein [Solobacterium sp.]
MAKFFDLCPDGDEQSKDAASHSGKDLTNDSLMTSIPMETPEGLKTKPCTEGGQTMKENDIMQQLAVEHGQMIQRYARAMAASLSELDEGTQITIRELSAGYRRRPFSDPDLLTMHDLVRKRAEELRIELEPLDDEDQENTRPFDLPYAVHNRRAQIKCPHCGSINTARYIFGLPSESETLRKKIDEGKVILGGCTMLGVEVNGRFVSIDAGRHCNECGKDFATTPVIADRERETGEDYRDITQSVTFSEGSFFDGYDEITITKNEEGALIHLDKTVRSLFGEDDTQITHEKWEEILDTLYCRLYVHEWNKSYVDPHILDGTQWSLDIQLTRDRAIHIGGSNAYPPYYDELKALFRNLRW